MRSSRPVSYQSFPGSCRIPCTGRPKSSGSGVIGSRLSTVVSTRSIGLRGESGWATTCSTALSNRPINVHSPIRRAVGASRDVDIGCLSGDSQVTGCAFSRRGTNHCSRTNLRTLRRTPVWLGIYGNTQLGLVRRGPPAFHCIPTIVLDIPYLHNTDSKPNPQEKKKEKNQCTLHERGTQIHTNEAIRVSEAGVLVRSPSLFQRLDLR
ncbi:hypothetical protein GGS23DRAFT_189938 [Durotheca rogersii]|uniref:uncharacterized protein n=1 Tax=Durotheca rogersii TaxID=419775 RepID=UPI00221E5481|nr:uncharacterized protein GGS23DRAFT_189938 [Durotheca rogersii]KAI5867697.1 hypothetical protein GGS23DRAFT_189938 [Durotheca rogersii]